MRLLVERRGLTTFLQKALNTKKNSGSSKDMQIFRYVPLPDMTFFPRKRLFKKHDNFFHKKPSLSQEDIYFPNSKGAQFFWSISVLMQRSKPKKNQLTYSGESCLHMPSFEDFGG